METTGKKWYTAM